MFERRFLFLVVVNICQQSQQKCTKQKHQGDTLVNRHGWNPFINVAHRPHLRGENQPPLIKLPALISISNVGS